MIFVLKQMSIYIIYNYIYSFVCVYIYMCVCVPTLALNRHAANEKGINMKNTD